MRRSFGALAVVWSFAVLPIPSVAQDEAIANYVKICSVMYRASVVAIELGGSQPKTEADSFALRSQTDLEAAIGEAKDKQRAPLIKLARKFEYCIETAAPGHYETSTAFQMRRGKCDSDIQDLKAEVEAAAY